MSNLALGRRRNVAPSPGPGDQRQGARPALPGRDAASAGSGEESGVGGSNDGFADRVGRRKTEIGQLHGSDLELVRRAAGGDGAAFHALVDRHAPQLFRLALSLSAGRADAEDVVQETFLGAHRSLKTFDGRSSVKTWLSRILVRQAARAWRNSRHARRSLPIDAADSYSPPAAGAFGGASGTAAVDRRIDIAAAVNKLSPEFRQVIVLREFQQMSYSEMAQVLGVPQGTVESRLHRARAELRSRLLSYGT